MAVGDSDSGLVECDGGASIQKGGPEGVFQLSGDHTPQSPWEREELGEVSRGKEVWVSPLRQAAPVTR